MKLSLFFIVFRDSQYLPPPTDQSTGAVNRQIRVTVRTVGDYHGDGCVNGYNGYHDAISILNLNRWCRRYGIPIPKSYWTRLWLVRDCAGGAGAGFTWFLIIAGEVLVLLTLASQKFSFFTLIHAILSLSCAGLGTIAHLRAMFSDPVQYAMLVFINVIFAVCGLLDVDKLDKFAKPVSFI